MHILLIQLNLHIPNAHSLKEKRKQIKSLKDRLSHRFNASVAEVGELDSWQKSVIALCLLSNDKSYLDKQFSLVEARVFEYADLELVSIERQWL